MCFLLGLIIGLAIGWLCKEQVWIEIQSWLGLQLDQAPLASSQAPPASSQAPPAPPEAPPAPPEAPPAPPQAPLASSQAPLASSQAPLASSQAPPPAEPPAPRRVDDLRQIRGIGPTYAKRFNQAGVYSFADLAALTPEEARRIVQVKEWQKIEPEVWLAEAKRLAG